MFVVATVGLTRSFNGFLLFPVLGFQTLWGMETPGQADNQRDLAIQANKKKVYVRVVPVPVTVPLSVPGRFGSKLSGSSVLHGSKFTM